MFWVSGFWVCFGVHYFRVSGLEKIGVSRVLDSDLGVQGYGSTWRNKGTSNPSLDGTYNWNYRVLVDSYTLGYKYPLNPKP